MILTLTSWGTAACGKVSEQTGRIPAAHAELNQGEGAAACLLMSRLGQLYSLGVKQSCREGTSAMKALPHYSPLTAHSVMGTAVGVGPHPACVHHTDTCARSGKAQMCAFCMHTQRNTQYFSAFRALACSQLSHPHH